MTAQNAERFYSSKIIKASGLLADTKTLFVHWDESKADEENLREARRTNIFGKASRSRVEDILTIFRQRYIPENGSGRVLRRLVRSDLPAEVVDRVLYYYAAQADPLIYDFVTKYLYDLHQRGRHVITVEDAFGFLDQVISAGQITASWSEATREGVARHLLATLRDFRVLQAAKGSPRKTFAPVHLPIEAFLYITFDIQREVASGERLLRHSHWRLFLLNVEAIERLFIEAHQLGYLRYEAAGSIVRIEFADGDLAALVKTIIERWQMWNR